MSSPTQKRKKAWNSHMALHTTSTAMTRPELCLPIESRHAVQLAQSLPSLSDQIDLPDPHPAYHDILASLRAKRLVSSHRHRVHRHGQRSVTSSPRPKAHSMPVQCTQSLSAEPSPKRPKTADDDVVDFTNTDEDTCSHSDPNASAHTSRIQPSDEKATNSQALPMLSLHIPRPNLSKAMLNSSYGDSSRSVSKPTLTSSPSKSFNVYATGQHGITTNTYVTSAEAQGFLSVYEFKVGNEAILIDAQSSYVLLTSICKAIGPMREDVVQYVETAPNLAKMCRKITSGFHKIRGTWVHYQLAFEICLRIAWRIRHDLVPLFGHAFPGKCLQPFDASFGDLRHLTLLRLEAQRTPVEARPSLIDVRGAKPFGAGQKMVSSPTSVPMKREYAEGQPYLQRHPDHAQGDRRSQWPYTNGLHVTKSAQLSALPAQQMHADRTNVGQKQQSAADQTTNTVRRQYEHGKCVSTLSDPPRVASGSPREEIDAQRTGVMTLSDAVKSLSLPRQMSSLPQLYTRPQQQHSSFLKTEYVQPSLASQRPLEHVRRLSTAGSYPPNLTRERETPRIEGSRQSATTSTCQFPQQPQSRQLQAPQQQQLLPPSVQALKGPEQISSFHTYHNHLRQHHQHHPNYPHSVRSNPATLATGRPVDRWGLSTGRSGAVALMPRQ